MPTSRRVGFVGEEGADRGEEAILLEVERFWAYAAFPCRTQIRSIDTTGRGSLVASRKARSVCLPIYRAVSAKLFKIDLIDLPSLYIMSKILQLPLCALKM